jgi:hypothetical protein
VGTHDMKKSSKETYERKLIRKYRNNAAENIIFENQN